MLKELKNFVHTGESIDAAVITIPASFDTIQSNATKKAGYEAGFKEVVLLQEPIAASLAYFNDSKKGIPEKGHWLVYDLGAHLSFKGAKYIAGILADIFLGFVANNGPFATEGNNRRKGFFMADRVFKDLHGATLKLGYQ